MDNCNHDNIVDGICEDCGLEFQSSFIDMSSSYSEYHSFMDTVTVQPFESDLKNLSIPQEVKNLVITLANSCSKDTHRMGVRRQQLFSYIYLAYLQLGFKFDPEKIKDELKMNQREVNMALRIISGTSSVDISLPIMEGGAPISAPVVVISPIIYLEELCKVNKVEEHTTKIIEMSKVLLKKNRILYEFNPRHIAISLIKHYLNISSISYPKFAKFNGISDSILKQHVTRIMKT